MPTVRYTVKEGNGFQSGSGSFVRVFNVSDTQREAWQTAQVWWSDERGHCANCQGIYAGMSGSCAHVRAVKRAVRRIEWAKLHPLARQRKEAQQ